MKWCRLILTLTCVFTEIITGLKEMKGRSLDMAYLLCREM